MRTAGRPPHPPQVRFYLSGTHNSRRNHSTALCETSLANSVVQSDDVTTKKGRLHNETDL